MFSVTLLLNICRKKSKKPPKHVIPKHLENKWLWISINFTLLKLARVAFKKMVLSYVIQNTWDPSLETQVTRSRGHGAVTGRLGCVKNQDVQEVFRVAYDGPIIWFGYMCMTFVSQLKCKTDKKNRLYNDSQGKWQLEKNIAWWSCC